MAVRALIGFAAAAAALFLVPATTAAVAPLRWCGNDVQQADRAPDRAGGAQIHVVYAIPSDGEDRSGSLASAIVTDAANIDAWWRAQDPTRAPRFDLFDFPGCDSRFGLLDLTVARLPFSAATLTGIEGRYERIAAAVERTPFELAELDKKYLVFYDGSVAPDGVCGTAGGSPTRGPDYAIVYLRSTCDLTIGDGRGAAYVAAHELLHALGALPAGAPNACPGDDGHPCDGVVDVLSTFYDGGILDAAVLDIGRNDYYGHPGSWFDLQDSDWLLDATAQFVLTLRTSGSGMIGSEPDGQGCTGTCRTEWNGGTSIQLAADPSPGWGFAAWTGPCASEREPSCLIDLSSSIEVGAIFRRLLRLTVRVSGRGTVSGRGVRCSRTCAPELLEGSRVALRAAAARGWRFVRWSGACRGSRPTCTVGVGRRAAVAALFRPRA